MRSTHVDAGAFDGLTPGAWAEFLGGFFETGCWRGCDFNMNMLHNTVVYGPFWFFLGGVLGGFIARAMAGLFSSSGK